jgi:hypothetical protein
VEATATGGTAPVERLLLLSGDSIVLYETAASCKFDTLRAGQYTLRARDAAGCLSDPRPVNIRETDNENSVDNNDEAAENNDGEITVYPNPTDGKVYISHIADDKMIFVYNISGTFLFSVKGNEVDFSPFPSGMYLLRIDNKVIKVIKL